MECSINYTLQIFRNLQNSNNRFTVGLQTKITNLETTNTTNIKQQTINNKRNVRDSTHAADVLDMLCNKRN